MMNTHTQDREIIISRTLNAPRELVFKVFTEAEHVAQWWGPNGFTNTILDMHVMPGGTWNFIMHGPDGVDYPNTIVFSEVVKPEKLVYMHGSGIENDPHAFHVEVSFEEEEGNKTKLTMRSVFKTAAARDHVVKEFGAIEGGNQTLERLRIYLENYSA